MVVTRRAPRQVRMFMTPTQISFTDDPRNQRTVLELVASDRPGLLSEVGKTFMNERVNLHGARISTVGERAEDVFYLSDNREQALDEPARARVEAALIAALDRRG